MEPEAVVRDAWDAYSAGDVDGALFPGPSTFRGHDELRVLLDTGSRFSVHHMRVTDIADMGGFVLAHGVVYAEQSGTTVIDRVTIWRCVVEGDVITSVRAEALPAGARWQEPRRPVFES